MKDEKKRCTAVILAAGNGSRMKSSVAKQYMLLEGKPLIWYALQAVEQSDIIDDCILVAGAEELAYVKTEIVQKYGFTKIQAIIAGGAERYLSVGKAMKAIEEGCLSIPNEEGYVFIHDGARPFLTEKILRSTYEGVKKYGACVAAVPSKDTVKIADEQGFVKDTPERRLVWSIQTPQVFDTGLIVNVYKRLLEAEEEAAWSGREKVQVTDDASAVELFTDKKVKLVEGSYENIKITTPEDLKTAEAFLKK